ncbi:hypothetical protein D7044_23420 [Micromonospora musae]|uniref:Uncharacterized protein n=1 Tax=Micromonospora musae TaxID=1894970 RepID=A0A3A9XVA0_9ACTN|nr:hypothetical protein D7044_23420 [Micromonospora musae]
MPIFVDATGRRARLMRWCGVLLAAGTLAYVPIVGVAVLTGPSLPRSAPLLDDETGMETGDQPPEQVGPRALPVSAGDESAGPVSALPNEALPRPSLLPEPEPERDRPVPAPPPPTSDGEPSPPLPSTAAPTPPPPSVAAPSPSAQTPPPAVTPTAPALLHAAARAR